MKVKICGITNIDDAAFASSEGADFVGLIFVPESPRSLTIEKAEKVLEGVRGKTEPVGLFRNAEIDTILRTIGKLHLRFVQLHGQESAEYVNQLIALLPEGVRIIKAVAIYGIRSIEELADYYQSIDEEERIEAFLLDGPGGGGKGKSFSWQGSAEKIHQVRNGAGEKSPPRIIVAGGLNPGNVGDAIRVLHPYGVDVSSGVESSPGKKDNDKVREFIRNAKGQLLN